MYFNDIIIFMFTTNVIAWNEYHIKQIDEGLPQINDRKECGISLRKCDPNLTFKDPFVSSRVFEGEFAQKGEFPWYTYMAIEALFNEKGKQSKIRHFICGSSILNEWWVLTAAHCIEELILGGITTSIVLFGGSDTLYLWNTMRYEVERVVIHHSRRIFMNDHQKVVKQIDDLMKQFIDWEINGNLFDTYPNYSQEYEKYVNLTNEKRSIWFWAYNYDMALLKVRQKIIPIFNETHYIVNTICLPTANVLNYEKESLVIMGFGKVSKTGEISDILKKGITQMQDLANCDRIAASIGFKGTRICTRLVESANTSLTKAETSKGDSGSPAHQYLGCQAVQVGIISFSTEKIHHWYQRVSWHLNWIRWSINNQNSTEVKSENFDQTSNSGSYPLLLVLTNLCLIIAVILSLILFWILATIALISTNKPHL